MRASASTRFLWLTALLLLSIYHSHLEGRKACHLPKSLPNTSRQEHTPISPKCLVCCILQGINLYHQWQNVLGIHIIWQLLHFAVTFPVTRILGTFSRRFPEDSPGHGSSPCHRCSRVQLPPVCLSPSLTPHIAPCQWFPGTRKKPFHPRDIWFRQADSRQVCECVIR